MNFLNRIFEGVQKDFRLFVFMLALLEIYRALFIWLMSDYISPESTSEQIQTALWTGLRLSLKTAGFVSNDFWINATPAPFDRDDFFIYIFGVVYGAVPVF